MNKKGFTLIEMLVVIAIIAVLVAIVVPTVSTATTKANAATNAANLRSAAASIAIEYMEGGLTVTDGVLSGYDTAAPSAKTVSGITGGTFAASIDDKGNITCAFGDDGTIDNYSDVAADGKLGS